MKKLLFLLTALLLVSCAAKKEKTEQPTLHNGKCANAGKTINCTWNNVSI